MAVTSLKGPIDMTRSKEKAPHPSSGHAYDAGHLAMAPGSFNTYGQTQT